MGKHVFEVTSANFETEVLGSDVPVLVDFTADWCPPCKMIAPIVDGLAQKYAGKLRVGELDADTHVDIVQRYGVMGLPTLLVFQGGKLAKTLVGYRPAAQIEAQLMPLLAVVTE